MRVALVHDDLIQWGGAERMLVALSELYPQAPIYTSLVDWDNEAIRQNFGNKTVITSFLQKLPGYKLFYKAFLPLYPLAFEQFDLGEYDLVISQTTRFAKAVITKPSTVHICYCHTPPRFLWHLPSDPLPKIIDPILSYLRFYDQIAAQRVDFWIAGSENARMRLAKIYHVSSDVCYPFVDLKQFEQLQTSDKGYFLIICRLNWYKRVDVAVEAFSKRSDHLKIIGEGPMLDKLKAQASKNVEFLGRVNEGEKLRLLAGCKALIITGEEDFGLTSLEAQALGKPVIAYGRGGAKETVVEGITGLFFSEQAPESLFKVLDQYSNFKFDAKRIKQNVKRFSKENFQKNFAKIVEAHLTKF